MGFEITCNSRVSSIQKLCLLFITPPKYPKGTLSPAGGLDSKAPLLPKPFSHYNNTPKYVTDLSRENRLNPTKQEEKLWLMICGKKLDGLKFRRQFPIGRYIVDFYNHANRLILEIDGGIHKETKAYDSNRDSYLSAIGHTVLRFTNDEIDSDINAVILRIGECLKVPLRGI